MPIIALTANALKGDRERFLEVGMDEYTTKPLVRNEILNLLSQFIGHKIVNTRAVDAAAKEKPAATAPAEAPESVAETAAAAAVTYDADILLAKKGVLENKLFGQLLDDLHYTYNSVAGAENLLDAVKNKNYKIVLFDQEIDGLDLKALHDMIAGKEARTSTVMMVDPGIEPDETMRAQVNDIIKNVINKDLLRLIFEKYV